MSLIAFVFLPCALSNPSEAEQAPLGARRPSSGAVSVPAAPGAPLRRTSSLQQGWHRVDSPARLPPGARGFHDGGLSSIRGVTLGPIESLLQPGRGYGSRPFDETLSEIQRLKGNWVSLTVFSRVWDKKSIGLDLSFERPHEETRRNVIESVRMAHARGLRVLLVPHLWLESGEWRAEMQPGGDARFRLWAESYSRFALYWAQAAQEAGVDMFAAGVELRSWVTTSRAPSFVRLIEEIRGEYAGLLTYAANWDDVEDTVILGHLDVIGINAFYPLHWQDNATWEQVEAGGARVRQGVKQLAKRFERPVVFTEFGYTTRKDTAIKPWLWPEELHEVEVDEGAQARAYAALLGSMNNVPGFAGAFVWRMYADISDMSQEAEWGFSPWGKLAQRELERTFRDPRFGEPTRTIFTNRGAQ